MTTVFAQAVYAATGRIPVGRVASYSAVARAIGAPRAARAVGSALHQNQNPASVPCHRVVAKSGDVGGFAWGRRRKAALLGAEGVRFDRRGRVPAAAFVQPQALARTR